MQVLPQSALQQLLPLDFTRIKHTSSLGHTQKPTYAVGDVALVSTVDGFIHAIERSTGLWKWSLHDPVSETNTDIGQPLVSGAINVTPANYASGALLSGHASSPTLDADTTSTSGDHVESDQIPEETYVVEPVGHGSIYVYHKSSNQMRKLPVSIAQLVELSPFTFEEDDTRMFVGKRTTSLIGVDLASGKLLGVFGPEAGWCEWTDGSRSMKVDDECDESIQSRPHDLLYIGKSEYQVSILSKKEGTILQTLSYTSYHPSSLVSPSHQQQAWVTTPDSRYIQSLHDGSLLSFKQHEVGMEWATTKFSAPVIGVFDVAFPLDPDGQVSPSAQPLIFRQPSPFGVDGLPNGFEAVRLMPDSVYIGKLHSTGALFAMSRQYFPLVSLTTAQEVNDRHSCAGVDCLVGMHQLAGQPSEPVSFPSTTDDAEDAVDQQTAYELEAVNQARLGLPQASTAYAPAVLPTLEPQPSLPPSPNCSMGNIPVTLMTITNSVMITIICVSIIVRFIWKRRRRLAARLRKATATARSEGRVSLLDRIIGAFREWERDTARINDNSLEALQPLYSTPQETALLESEKSASGKKEELLHSKSTSDTMPLARAVKTNKELPPIPFLTVREDEATQTPTLKSRVTMADDTLKDESSGESEGDEQHANTNKKKSRARRKRGRRPAQQRAVAEAAYATLEKEVDENGVLIVKAGSLVVTDQVLGYGSHGTVVLKGTFQGRAVAVKRLLKHFVTIADQEVSLLQESDEHPNVIRYFCKEHLDNFFYIALELCPASLADVFEAPDKWPELVAGFDPKRALRQIGSGLAHLHRLKIVHRDIKPQNILVSLSKPKGRVLDGPVPVRMLISDFGLCKRLELDESSFLQTYNHAAGSFGYRAPEVLRGEVNPNEAQQASSSSKSVSISDLLDVSSLKSLKRLTRSVDIFSLGCIFYYVLTSGEHPFGSRYEREINILKANCSLDRLNDLGEEAHEAQSLIRSMISDSATARPSADAVLLHPFFWTASMRLNFLCEASDRFEIMERDPPEPILQELEALAPEVVSKDWTRRIDKSLLDNLGKYRKYDAASVRDLLRVIRNKRHHYHDLPENVRKSLGSPPEDFLAYFTQRFPLLFLHVWSIVRDHLQHEALFATHYFRAAELI